MVTTMSATSTSTTVKPRRVRPRGDAHRGPLLRLDWIDMATFWQLAEGERDQRTAPASDQSPMPYSRIL
jgi:hypothetical protein